MVLAYQAHQLTSCGALGCPLLVAVQVSRLMGMGPDENVAEQIAGKLEGMLEVVRKVRGCRCCLAVLDMFRVVIDRRGNTCQ